tara:strand:+ start:97 stop:228 length:132 start_codon:yes stop_codon:yes gene_type:complete
MYQIVQKNEQSWEEIRRVRKIEEVPAAAAEPLYRCPRVHLSIN